MLPELSAWKRYRLGDLFAIERAAALNGVSRQAGSVPYVGASARNNGVTERVGNAPNFKGGCITLSYDGSIGEAFYQPVPFVLGEKVCALVPKKSISPDAALFICAVIRLEKFRYSYGRKWVLGAMRDTTILLPAAPDGTPHWKVMGAHIMGLRDAALKREAANTAHLSKPADTEPVTLPEMSKWGEFRLDALFDMARGGKKKPGDELIPYVTASGRNNGVTDYREYAPDGDAGSVTITADGACGDAFVQPTAFAVDPNVVIGKFKTAVPPDAALFICAVIRLEKFRYSYGRKWGLEAMRTTVLRLPVTDDGTPDWTLMAGYIRTLPYSGVLAGRG